MAMSVGWRSAAAPRLAVGAYGRVEGRAMTRARVRPWLPALLAALLLLASALGDRPPVAASGPAGADIIQVPVRWCALRGSAAVEDPASLGRNDPDTDAVLLRRLWRASRTWLPGGIELRSAATGQAAALAHFPIIKDPGGRGGAGAVVDPRLDGYREFDRVIARCEAAWDRLRRDLRRDQNVRVPNVGPIAVNIRRFVDARGRKVSLLGWGGGSYVQRRRSGGTTGVVCGDERVVAASGGRLMVADRLADYRTDGRLIAHELGHILKLGHGNGIDDDRDGAIDHYCDADEDRYAPPASLMNPWLPDATATLTKPQQGLGARIARAFSGAVVDPPGELLPGDALTDETPDGIEDVDDASVDVTSVSVATNEVEGALALAAMLKGSIPDGQANRYAFYLDLDGDPATGGVPDSAGFASGMAGVDLIAVVAVDPGGVVTPTILRWTGAAFEDATACCGDAVAATLEPVLDEDAHHVPPDAAASAPPLTVVRQVVSLVIGFEVARPGPAPALVRIQTSASSPDSGAADVLPGGPGDPLGEAAVELFLEQPSYPVCAATPGSALPGETVVVEAAGLGPPGASAVVALDEAIVGGGTVGEDGSLVTGIVIPADAEPGIAPLSVVLSGTAVAADCALEVRAAAGPSGAEPSAAPESSPGAVPSAAPESSPSTAAPTGAGTTDACEMLTAGDLVPLMPTVSEASDCPSLAHFFDSPFAGSGDCSGYPADGPLAEWCPPSPLSEASRLVEVNLQVSDGPSGMTGEPIGELGEGAMVIESLNEVLRRRGVPISATRMLTFEFPCGERTCLLEHYLEDGPPIAGGSAMLRAQTLALARLIQARAAGTAP